MLQSGRLQVQVPMRSLEIFNLPSSSSRIMALGSIQPLTEMSTRNLPGARGRPARKADNLTAICEPIFFYLHSGGWNQSPLDTAAT
jgi:acetyl esterase/lipase